jgi:hypothetical protein
MFKSYIEVIYFVPRLWNQNANQFTEKWSTNRKDFILKGIDIQFPFFCICVYITATNKWSKLPYSWNKVLAPIWNSEDVPASVLLSGRLREKDKALIKEKFSVGFLKLK